MAALCRGGGGAVQEWRRQIGLQGGGGFRKGAAPRRRGSGGARGGAARGEQGGSAGPAEETPGRRHCESPHLPIPFSPGAGRVSRSSDEG
ncbi:hypothetical protein E2562_007309 [Oryza meyeriana var. granulata]|uniref:Uncharacterized protein n=1 Tax=Oryza meyeriana var. granulata TaxID=110450 RepID=A0A6G1CZA0_9ORYZ|nr:hypothetical protein E2562_007309 [Oryza meyeriana var. granulata]